MSKPKSDRPINVALPNTTAEKMIAIANLASAVKELSYALNSVNIEVTIANNTISTPKTAIRVETK